MLRWNFQNIYPSTDQALTIDNNGTTKQNDERQSSYNISQGFRKEEKFIRKLGSEIFKYVSSYEEACRDNAFTMGQHLKYFLSLLNDEGMIFYRENISLIYTSYRAAR